MGPEDAPVDEGLYESALGIVLDTASEARISNKNYQRCKELIKIDHHIPWSTTAVSTGWRRRVPPAVRWWWTSTGPLPIS